MKCSCVVSVEKERSAFVLGSKPVPQLKHGAGKGVRSTLINYHDFQIYQSLWKRKLFLNHYFTKILYFKVYFAYFTGQI